MTTDNLAHALIELHAKAGKAPGQWIQLLAAGPNKGLDGRGPFEVKDPAAVIRASQAAVAGGLLPVDINHAIDLEGAAGRPSPAAGWVTALEWRKNGMWGYAEWTPSAATALQNKEYRFISPAIAHDGAGTVRAVLRASLTNNPNLNLIALNAAERGTGKEAMSANTLAELRTLLGLTDTADDAAVVEKVRQALTSLNTVDPAKYVPIELFQKAVKELNVRNESGMTREDATEIVHLAINNHFLLPFMEKWAVDLCMRDKKAYDDFIVSSGGQAVHGFVKELVKPTEIRRLERMTRERAFLERAGGAGGTLTEADEIARNLGHSADDVKKFGGNG